MTEYRRTIYVHYQKRFIRNVLNSEGNKHG